MRPGTGASTHLEGIAGTRPQTNASSEDRWSLLASVYFVIQVNLVAWALIVLGAIYLF